MSSGGGLDRALEQAFPLLLIKQFEAAQLIQHLWIDGQFGHVRDAATGLQRFSKKRLSGQFGGEAWEAFLQVLQHLSGGVFFQRISFHFGGSLEAIADIHILKFAPDAHHSFT